MCVCDKPYTDSKQRAHLHLHRTPKRANEVAVFADHGTASQRVGYKRTNTCGNDQPRQHRTQEALISELCIFANCDYFCFVAFHIMYYWDYFCFLTFKVMYCCAYFWFVTFKIMYCCAYFWFLTFKIVYYCDYFCFVSCHENMIYQR